MTDTRRLVVLPRVKLRTFSAELERRVLVEVTKGRVPGGLPGPAAHLPSRDG